MIISKKILIILLIMFCLNSIYSDSNGIWTYPRDIKPGVFGEDESIDFTENFTFNHVVYFNNNIIINEIIDNDNSLFRIDLSNSSTFKILNSDVYYSRGSNQYFLDPKDNSRLNNLNIIGLLELNGVNINDLFVNEGQINSITGNMIVDGTIQGSDLSSIYQSGEAYDYRFVNVGELDSITSDMILDSTIITNDIDVANFSNLFATIEYVDNVISDIDLGELSLQAGWYSSCPSGWVDTQLSDCDTGDGHRVQEAGCDYVQSGDPKKLCLKIQGGEPPSYSIPICSGSNQALGWDGSSWICNSISGETDLGSENDLVFEEHSSDQCLSRGGQVVGDGSGNSFCRFNSASCPGGWNQYNNWGISSSNTCSGSSWRCNTQCSTGSHGWSNAGLETCLYNLGANDNNEDCNGCNCAQSYGTCQASYSEVGCY